jgi:hypothetical protein
MYIRYTSTLCNIYIYIIHYRSKRDTRQNAYVCIRLHTSAYVSIRQHTSAHVSIRQHTSAYVFIHYRSKRDTRQNVLHTTQVCLWEGLQVWLVVPAAHAGA